MPVDDQARMDAGALRGMLEDALTKQQAIYSVVAIIGSTEHGAVDPLVSVLKLRQEFEKKGLSFVVHCDAAWGGYFASCIRDTEIMREDNFTGIPVRTMGFAEADNGFVPTMALTPYTQKQLAWFGRADSITIDPHKSGYCPYPAGGLCYRDSRMRYLVTWTSPVVYRGEVESIGVYGVEGSKPGASAGIILLMQYVHASANMSSWNMALSHDYWFGQARLRNVAWRSNLHLCDGRSRTVPLAI